MTNEFLLRGRGRAAFTIQLIAGLGVSLDHPDRVEDKQTGAGPGTRRLLQ